ncbi:hypothetical protein RQP46_008264 [Phenoliferia psychrophenolica]
MDQDSRSSSPLEVTVISPRKPKVAAPAQSKAHKRQSSLGDDNGGDKKKIKLVFSGENKIGKIILNRDSTGAVELERRRSLFWGAHKDVYLAVLPRKNAIRSLVENAEGRQFKEAVPYRLLEQPKCIQGGMMKDYQLSGLSFLAWLFENGQSGILGDEMGLGKTLQTLSLFAYLSEAHNIKGPHLLICPLSVLSAWMTEIARWLPSFTATRLHGPKTERERIKNLPLSDLVVTTYESYQAESAWFRSRRWGVCVLDEGHKIKNSESQISKELQPIRAQMRLILSGTPIQNNLCELWSLLHFLTPDIFTEKTLDKFQKAFNLSLGVYDQSFLTASSKLLELVMLRRTKDSVKLELSVPPREELTLYVPLSPVQTFWYKRLLTRMDALTLEEIFPHGADVDEGVRENVKHALAGGTQGSAWKQMNHLLMQLRQCCDHPYILPDAEQEPFEVAEHIVASSSKLILLDKLLADLVPKKRKVLIFSGFTRMLDLVEDFLTLRGYGFGRIDGNTSRPRRVLEIRLFQQEQGPYEVLLVSTRAGGLGINLTAASAVVMCDSDWNPQIDLQAIARAHRIGQTQTVQVYRLICQDSVEEMMLGRIRKKLYLSAKVMSGMQNTAQNGNRVDRDEDDAVDSEKAPKMSRSELTSILRGGTGAIAKWGTDGANGFAEFRDASLADLLARGKERDNKKEVEIQVDAGEEVDPERRRQLAQEADEEEERLLLAGKELVRSREFEGKTWHKSTNAEIREELDRTMRRAGKDRTVIVDGHSVSVETLGNRQWEAVKTITSDPEKVKKLANTKRKAVAFEHEEFCIDCKDGGKLFECSGCPRTAHADCVGMTERALSKTSIWMCPQHNCGSCGRSTGDAGGLLFRCECCPVAFCDDCLPENFESIGEELPQFRALGFPKRAQAYYIRCSDCVELFTHDQGWAAWFKKEVSDPAWKILDKIIK